MKIFNNTQKLPSDGKGQVVPVKGIEELKSLAISERKKNKMNKTGPKGEPREPARFLRLPCLLSEFLADSKKQPQSPASSEEPASAQQCGSGGQSEYDHIKQGKWTGFDLNAFSGSPSSPSHQDIIQKNEKKYKTPLHSLPHPITTRKVGVHGKGGKKKKNEWQIWGGVRWRGKKNFPNSMCYKSC